MNFAKSYLSKAAPVEPTIQNGRVVARLTCADCGAKDDWTVASKMPPPEILTKHFSNQGWLVRKKATCPSCRINIFKGVARCQHLLLKSTRPNIDTPDSASDLTEALKRWSQEPEDQQKEITPMSNVAPVKTEQAPTEAVKAARRKANEFLMFNFDVDKGRYEDGWSDERVAKESGMPLAWVVRRRDEEYGPLKEPSEFAELRKEAAALASEIGKLNAKLEVLLRQNG